MQVMFAFDGYGRGEYPDHSKFQPEDLRSPDIVVEALNRQKLDTTEDFQGKVQSALTIDPGQGLLRLAAFSVSGWRESFEAGSWRDWDRWERCLRGGRDS